MSTALDRVNTLKEEAGKMRDIMRDYGKPDTVTLFAEDYDFLEKQKQIENGMIHHYTFGHIKIKRGYRKRKPRKRRPKEALL